MSLVETSGPLVETSGPLDVTSGPPVGTSGPPGVTSGPPEGVGLLSRPPAAAGQGWAHPLAPGTPVAPGRGRGRGLGRGGHPAAVGRDNCIMGYQLGGLSQ